MFYEEVSQKRLHADPLGTAESIGAFKRLLPEMRDYLEYWQAMSFFPVGENEL